MQRVSYPKPSKQRGCQEVTELSKPQQDEYLLVMITIYLATNLEFLLLYSLPECGILLLHELPATEEDYSKLLNVFNCKRRL
jgi:hypothetical protein